MVKAAKNFGQVLLRFGYVNILNQKSSETGNFQRLPRELKVPTTRWWSGIVGLPTVHISFEEKRIH